MLAPETFHAGPSSLLANSVQYAIFRMLRQWKETAWSLLTAHAQESAAQVAHVRCVLLVEQRTGVNQNQQVTRAAR
jgi:hypothetical protein